MLLTHVFTFLHELVSIMETAFRRQEYGFKRQGNLVKEKSPLHQINWHRIILDEVTKPLYEI